MFLGRGLRRVRLLAIIFVVACVQVFQQLKPPKQLQQSGQGVDDASIVREKASVTLFIGVDAVSACTNRVSPPRPPCYEQIPTPTPSRGKGWGTF